MAKGKHALNKGALKQADKVLHPSSRKVKKVARATRHKTNVDTKGKPGLVRLAAQAERLAWVREALPGAEGEAGGVSCAGMLALAQGLLARFDDELEQIKIKNSIGGGQKNKRKQHSAREDAIGLAVKTETSDFEGCGLELPDLFDLENLEYFRNWEGEVRFVQNIKLRRFKKADLEAGSFDSTPEEAEAMEA
jgi:hypothetical protein